MTHLKKTKDFFINSRKCAKNDKINKTIQSKKHLLWLKQINNTDKNNSNNIDNNNNKNNSNKDNNNNNKNNSNKDNNNNKNNSNKDNNNKV